VAPAVVPLRILVVDAATNGVYLVSAKYPLGVTTRRGGLPMVSHFTQAYAWTSAQVRLPVAADFLMRGVIVDRCTVGTPARRAPEVKLRVKPLRCHDAGGVAPNSDDAQLIGIHGIAGATDASGRVLGIMSSHDLVQSWLFLLPGQ